MEVKNLTELFNGVVIKFDIIQGKSVSLTYNTAKGQEIYTVQTMPGSEIISYGMIEKLVGSTILYAEIVSDTGLTIFHIFTSTGSSMFRWKS